MLKATLVAKYELLVLRSLPWGGGVEVLSFPGLRSTDIISLFAIVSVDEEQDGQNWNQQVQRQDLTGKD